MKLQGTFPIRFVSLVFLISAFATAAFAITPDQKTLPQKPSAAERELSALLAPLAKSAPAATEAVPSGYVHALGEWEDSEGVIFNWTNASMFRELSRRGRVFVPVDSAEDRAWWDAWFLREQVNRQNIQYLPIATDSIWVRDWGPWFILNGDGKLGIVDNGYYPARPKDDAFPLKLAELMNIPSFGLGLSVEGGNFYPDGVGNGFSTTYINHQNKPKTPEEIADRFKTYLGIRNYTRFDLGDSATGGWEHMDTYGKLVSPSTWVVAEFPEGSKYRAGAEAFAAHLATLTSGNGTRYQVFRMRMIPKDTATGNNPNEEHYRGYINSFISNRTLYYATYGGPEDAYARSVYEQAMPGYEIVGVDGKNTWWGDAVHCRARNMNRIDGFYLFARSFAVPKAMEEIQIAIHARPTPGHVVSGFPTFHYRINDGAWQSAESDRWGPGFFYASLPGLPAGTRVSYWIEAQDTSGRRKTVPLQAPVATVDFVVEAAPVTPAPAP